MLIVTLVKIKMSQSENEVLEYTANVLFSSSESEGEFSGFEADSAEPKQCQQRKLKSVVKRVHKSSTRTDVNTVDRVVPDLG